MSLKVDIKKRFKGFSLDISFDTIKEFLGLLGASGSGKSMTLKCIAGIETPDEGYIELNDRILFDSEKKINLKPQDRNIGYLFQNYALFPNMNIEENIGAGLKSSKNEKKIIVEEMIRLFHLQGLEKKYPLQMSGGQQQRVALARCMAYKPDMLLLDEPFSALDTHLKNQVQTEMLELLKLYTGEVLMVTHSIEEAYKFCKNTVVIEEGKSVLFGDTKDIFNNPKLVSAAKLTGCKNISISTPISTNKLFANDWDFEIKINKTVNATSFIGIQSVSFEIIDDYDLNNNVNVMECEIIDIIDKIHGYTVIFKNKNSKNNVSHLFFDVRRDSWDNRKDKQSLLLKIPEDSILLLK